MLTPAIIGRTAPGPIVSTENGVNARTITEKPLAIYVSMGYTVRMDNNNRGLQLTELNASDAAMLSRDLSIVYIEAMEEYTSEMSEACCERVLRTFGPGGEL